MLPSIESTLETMTRKILLSRMRDAGVTMMKGYRVSRIEDTGVVVTGEEEKEIFVEAEKVVMAIGNRSDDTLYDRIQSLGYEIHKIGDCLEPRSAKAAIYEGAVLGRSI
jgi:pyruvate/2-oxoglutarate dehydrogenase complex dihydrolipoamide dehydrogenase (E3) component